MLTGFFGTLGLYAAVTDEMNQHADELLAQVGLSKVESQSYSTLSSGERVRSLIARALALDPGYAHAKALICRLTETARSERWLSMEEAASCLPLAEDEVVAQPSRMSGTAKMISGLVSASLFPM